jgi:CRISPR-associated protein Cas2
MLVLITYDVNTSDAAGRGRLRRIAKECVNYGQRVQNSVFECLLDTAQCRKLQNELCKIIDPEKDSLRFYYLGKKYENIPMYGAGAPRPRPLTAPALCPG